MTTTCFMYYRRRSSRASPSARLGACYPRATLCGVSHGDGSVTLAPDDSYVIQATDEVVLLAESSTVDITPVDEAVTPRKVSFF